MKIFKILIFSLLILCVIFIGSSLFFYLKKTSQANVIPQRGVKISFLVVNETEYTLNFDQQNLLSDLINTLSFEFPSSYLASSFTDSAQPYFEVHLFDQSKITVLPFKIEGDSFIRINLDSIVRDYQVEPLFEERFNTLINHVKS